MNDEQIQIMWNEFKLLLLSTERAGMSDLIDWLDSTDFKYAPASSQYHNSFRGGLLKHSLNVYNCLKDFKNLIDFMEIPQDTLIITALLHDICKIDCYIESTRNVKDETGQWVQVPFYKYDELLPWGHGHKSVILILQHGVMLDNTEISMIVNHMGYTEHDDPRRVGKLFRVCPQSSILHWADGEATNMFESYDGPKRFIDKIKLGGNNLTECYENYKKLQEQKSFITVEGQKYLLAPEDAVVDNEKIIIIPVEGVQYKVYSPYGDGLPF